jgi:hypothetical protein
LTEKKSQNSRKSRNFPKKTGFWRFLFSKKWKATGFSGIWPKKHEKKHRNSRNFRNSQNPKILVKILRPYLTCATNSGLYSLLYRHCWKFPRRILIRGGFLFKAYFAPINSY